MTDTAQTANPAAPALLAFDTSTASLAAAVVRDGAVLASVQSFAERNHSVRIVPEIMRLLGESGVSPEALGAVAVGQGPGSYTGVRIAVSVGKTLAWAWGKPLLGVSSLEALACGAWESRKAEEDGEAEGRTSGPVWLVPVMDARRGRVYTARWRADGEGRWERIDEDGIRLAADWAEKLRADAAGLNVSPRIWLIGETGPHEAVFGVGREDVPAVRPVPFAMEASAVARLAAARLARGERENVHAFVPNYTQLAEAEAKRIATAGRD